MSEDLFSDYAIYANKHSRLPKQDIRVPGIVECMVRALGFKRFEPFYGVDGDRIAERYPHRGWDWAKHGYQEEEPAWITEGKQNEMAAHFILAFMAMNVAVVIYIIAEKTKPQEQPLAVPPPQVRYAQLDQQGYPRVDSQHMQGGQQRTVNNKVQFYVER